MKGDRHYTVCMLTPDDILENAPKGARIIHIEANVIAYIGDLLHAMKKGLYNKTIEDPAMFSQTAPSNTASARNPS